MTDQQKFEEWWADKSLKFPAQVRYSGIAKRKMKEAFLAALAIGRRERTVEIEELAYGLNGGYLCHPSALASALQLKYPECFEKGEG